MDNSGFYDLDELVLRCRYPQTRQHFEESVRCYRSGAYRSCIVAAWLSVVYDFIYKINILHLEGDGKVKDLVARIEAAQGTDGIEASQRLERELVDDALKLELISPVEATFLKRLQSDRHLCAHPAMQTLDEPFQATAELARLHLRNAVEHFLQNPPVQGKAALQRIQADIDSEGFPRTVEGAVEYFKAGRMLLARSSLIRSLAITLTKSLLIEPEVGDRKKRQFAALGATLSTFPSDGLGGVRDCITNSASKIADENIAHLFAYVRFVPESWNLIEEWVRIKMRTFLETGEPKTIANSLLHASKIPSLQEIAKSRLEDIPSELIVQFEELQQLPESIDKVVERYISSVSFDSAKFTGRYLVQLKDYLNLEQRQRVIQAYAQNSQIAGCFQGPGYIYEVVQSAGSDKEKLLPFCHEVYENVWGQTAIDNILVSLFPELINVQKKNPFAIPFVADDDDF